MTTQWRTSSNGCASRGEDGQEEPTRGRAMRVAVWYALVGAAWIAVSGRLVHQYVLDRANAALLEDVTGWVFVLLTAALLWLMLDRQFAGIRRWARRIRDSEAALVLVEDNLPGSYVYQYVHDKDGEPYFTHVSAGVERVHGLSAAEVLRDRNCLFDQIDPAHRAMLAAAEAQSALTLSDVDIELRARRRDGQERLLRLRARPRWGGDGSSHWDGFATDISESRRAERALAESEALLRETQAMAKVGGWDIDVLTGTGHWTDEVARIHDLPPGAAPGIPGGLTFYPGEARARIEAAVRQAIEEAKPYDLELEFLSAAGRRKWVRTVCQPVVEDGRVVRLHGSIQDVTERRLLEAQLIQAQKMEAIGHLAGGVAHDFNNILAAILMQAELTSRVPNLPGEVSEGLAEMRSAAERAAALTRQLLLFSRKQVMQLRDLDLNDLVTSLVKMLQRIIGEDVQLQLHLHPSPLTIRADSGMIDQTLMNLAVNARDAMPGGGRLLVETRSATLEADAAGLPPGASPGRYVTLTVTDTGCGIPPHVLPRIFEPFFTTKEAGKGTGLGLATAFGIVRQHQGWIAVDSEPGRGASFQIYLPATSAAAHEVEASRVEPGGGTETILLVEDDRAVRGITRRTLEGSGYKVLEAASGTEALALWERHRQSVALLLTDLVMPGDVTGYALARRIQDAGSSVKIIYSSGYSPELAGGGTSMDRGETFLQKPYLPDQLLAAVRRVLDS